MSKKRPLVTFFVISCNFEKFIRESVEGAFAQTYSPLEIILSDDCSDDGTFEVMRAMASQYRGPHTVRLNHFDRRQGFGAHISHLLSMANGELHVVSSADDVSLPSRTEIVVRAWEETSRRANLIYSKFQLIDENSHPLEGDHGDSIPVWNTLLKTESGRFTHEGEPIRWVEHRPDARAYATRRVQVKASGCANSASAKLYQVFGPILPNLPFEDLAMVFRALLIGSIAFVDASLVKYRRHGLNISTLGSAGPNLERQIQLLKWNILTFEQFAKDVQTAAAKGLISPPESQEMTREITRQRKVYELKCECVTAAPWRIPELTCRLLKSGAGPRTLLAELNRMIRPPYPRPLHN